MTPAIPISPPRAPELTSASRWLSPPASPRVERGAIDVWRALDSAAPGRIDALKRLFSPDELERAAALRFDRDRRRFILCRGILRELLGDYLNRSPESIDFVYQGQGKPALPDQPLHFNMSHAAGMSLFAFADQPVGVDIERVDRELNFLAVARRHLAPADATAIGSAPLRRRAELFFAAWTAHEAKLKSAGRGISDLAAALTESPWCCFVPVGPDFTAALAAQHPPGAIRLWDRG